MERSRWNGLLRWWRSRSVSVATPMISSPSTSGTWWTRRSSMNSSISYSEASAASVCTGRVHTRDTGVSDGRPRASTRLRRSRSVRIAGGRVSTSTELTP